MICSVPSHESGCTKKDILQKKMNIGRYKFSLHFVIHCLDIFSRLSCYFMNRLFHCFLTRSLLMFIIFGRTDQRPQNVIQVKLVNPEFGQDLRSKLDKPIDCMCKSCAFVKHQIVQCSTRRIIIIYSHSALFVKLVYLKCFLKSAKVIRRSSNNT